MYATIEPVPAFPKPAVALFINNVTVWPSSEAQFGWLLRDADGGQAGAGNLTLSGDAYAAWGTDDAYLYTYTATALGLTIVEIVPVVRLPRVSFWSHHWKLAEVPGCTLTLLM